MSSRDLDPAEEPLIPSAHAEQHILQLFLHRAPAAFAMFDREMRYLVASRRWRSNHKLGLRDLRGVSHYDVFPGIPEAWKLAHRRCLAGETLRSEGELFPHLDGTEQWVRWELHPWREANGEIGGIVIFSEDITPQKQVDAQLRQSEDRFDALFHNSLDAIFLAVPDGTITAANAVACALFGMSEEEICEAGRVGLCDPEDKRHEAFLAERARTGTASGELTYVRKDGTKIIAEVKSAVFSKHPLRSFVVVRDVTESRLTERALRESEARFRAVAENSHDTILFWNEKAVLTWRSDTQLSGYVADERIGRPAAELVHPDDLPNFWQVWAAVLEHPDKPHEITCRLRRKDDSYVWINMAFRNMIANPDVRAVVVAARNVTAQVTAEQELRSSESRLRSILDTISEGVWEWHIPARKGYVSPRYLTALGYAPGEYKEGYEAFRASVHPEDLPQVEAAQNAHLAGEEAITVEFRVREKSGGWRWIRSRGRLVERDAQGRPTRLLGAFFDITARKRAEAALAESDALYRALVEGARDGITLRRLQPDDSPGALVAVNRCTLERLGYTREEFMALMPGDFLAPEAHEKSREAWAAVVAQGVFHHESIHITKDGRRIPVDVNVSLVSVGDERFVLWVARDISERKRAEESLRKTTQHLVGITACVPDVIWTMDFSGKFTYASPAAERMCGWTAEEMASMTRDDLLLPEGLAESARLVQEELQLAIRPGYDRKRVVTFEAEHRRKDGTTFTAEFSATPLWADDGRPVGIIGVTRDVTARNAAERSLRQTTQQLVGITACVPDVIWVMDLADRFTYLSPAVERMTGWSAEEAMQMGRKGLMLPDGFETGSRLLVEELRRVAVPGYDRNRVASFECEYRNKAGSTFAAEVTATFMWSDQGQPVGIVGVTRDITVRKQLEDERTKLAAQLSQAQKMESVGRLAGGVAHDFNNLLTVINGQCELAMAQLASDNPVRQELQEILGAGERAARLTEQLLAFSRRQVLKPQTMDLNRLVDPLRKMLQRMVGEDVLIRADLDREPCWVHADPQQLEHVIFNLAVNARDAMPGGGRLLLKTRLSDRAAAPGSPAARSVLLSVTDTGTGIAAGTLQHIFEPFFTTKEIGKGTGLGLSTVQGIVAQSGGSIEVDSALGKGTTFNIFLPLAPGVAEEATVAVAGESAAGGETLLVVEDQEDVLRLLLTVLKEYGYNALGASDAEAALSIWEAEPARIDLILTDIIMPGMTGAELVRKIRERRADARVLFMSGYADDVLLQQRVIEPGVDFIQKPFSLRDLAARIRRVLAAPMAG